MSISLSLYLKMIGSLNKIGINRVGIVGMGGIGKTQLAVEFAYRFSFGLREVYWIQASDPGTWSTEFVSLARNLGLKINDPKSPDAARQYIYVLQHHFKEHPGTLVIMDNVVEPKHLNSDAYLFGLTPLSIGCDLLFTTRKHFSIPGVLVQPLSVLSQGEAYALLSSYRTPQTQAEQQDAYGICNIVGYLPLAIVLVGARLRYLLQEQPEVSFADCCATPRAYARCHRLGQDH